MSNPARALHIFRRDLRLNDNTSLIEALKNNTEVIPCFILDPRQVSEKNEYRSTHAMQFMFASLRELDEQLREVGSQLYLLHGEAETVLKELLSNDTLNISHVCWNRDYSRFAVQRDAALEKVCAAHSVTVSVHADALLHEPEDIHKDNGTPYTVFTPFYKRALTVPVRPVTKNNFTNYFTGNLTQAHPLSLLETFLPTPNDNLKVKGGRREGLALLEKLSALSDYKEMRNYPAAEHTSYLSAHHKFGTISVRETLARAENVFGRGHHFISEVYWRDFFTHIAHHFPDVFGNAFQKQFATIPWKNNERHFAAWCAGKTGYPIVDAGMRELNATGYMHNRVRMITASFLVKDLLIDWQWGEKYFAQKLVDYDPCVNNGSWQWAASTGCDAQPYFRIFNPWLQQERFDPECKYILQWLPELRRLRPKEIHGLAKEQKPLLTDGYPSPIVNHSFASAATKELFKKVKEQHT